MFLRFSEGKRLKKLAHHVNGTTDDTNFKGIGTILFTHSIHKCIK